MKLFVKKAVNKKPTFTAINKSALKQVKGGGKLDRGEDITDLD